jgi:hypothetical protein
MKLIKEITETRRENLRRWIDTKCDQSQSKFIEKTGINQGELSGLLRNKSFGEKKARSLEDLSGMPNLWLDIDQDGDISIASYIHNSVIEKKHTGIIIEQYDAVGAMGNGLVLKDQSGVISEWNVSEEWVRLNLRNYTSIQNIKIVTGFGDSMQGTFNSGDPVIIDIGVKAVEFDSAYFFRVGNEGYIKRLQRVPGIGLRAISANKEYEPWSITADMDFEVFGVVLKTFNSINFQ